MGHGGGVRPYLQTMSPYLRKTDMEARDFNRVRLHLEYPNCYINNVLKIHMRRFYK